jgi:tetratricopeptide (TPR) repeat protein
MATIDQAIQAVRDAEYLEAFNLFLEIYGTADAPPINTPKAASGLSWFGLCLALVRKEYKPAIDLCQRAINTEFYNGDHYANLARIYLIAGKRKKAVETADAGLKVARDNPYVRQVRQSLGVRARPALPFLDRTNPINVSLGQARHAKKVADREKKKRS